ncbi:hypothetical protein LPJ58_004880, partial [Coemansia sp. RSA 1591]
MTLIYALALTQPLISHIWHFHVVVFCGSEKYPYLGYIDAVASHNLGQPMNASTYPDMTIYKFAGLGQEGAANVLPVVLDHVMHPLIQDNHFATE